MAGLVSVVAAPAPIRDQWTRRSGTQFLGTFKSADPVLLTIDDGIVSINDTFLNGLFKMLHDHPDMSATQILEMINKPDVT